MSASTTLKVRRSLHKDLKIAAIHEGKTLEELSEQFLTNGLLALTAREPSKTKGSRKLPKLAEAA